jgi:phosphoglycerate dehydrogenase-like enzyme
MSVIFICTDTVQNRLLDRVAQILRDEDHHTVIRGPVDAGAKIIKRYTADEVATLIAPADIAVFTIRHECSQSLIDAAPRLRGICYPTTGVESLDLVAASRQGVIVGHGATSKNSTGLAEATLMLMLALFYDLHGSEALLRQGRTKPPYPVAREILGKTIGIVGFGRIARALADRLAPFGVNILTYSPRVREDDLPAHVRKADLRTVMSQSDLVCLLMTITPETRGMIGATELGWMKKTAFLVNTGRGEAVDEDALYRALADRQIAGAALDTFVVEPLPMDSPLRRLDNVILTPHNVGQTREADDEFMPVMVENIRRILAGQLPTYCKNPEAEAAWRARTAPALDA